MANKVKQIKVGAIVVKYYEGGYSESETEEAELREFIEEMTSQYASDFEGTKLIDMTVDEGFLVDGVKYDYVGGRLYRL